MSTPFELRPPGEPRRQPGRSRSRRFAVAVTLLYSAAVLLFAGFLGLRMHDWARQRIVQSSILANIGTPIVTAADAVATEMASPADAGAVAGQPQDAPPVVTPEPTPTFTNILLLGTDERPDESGPSRTDTMILLSISPQEKTMGLLSLPRDLWVPIPGQNITTKINTAYGIGQAQGYEGGGAQLAKDTVSSLIGRPVDYYVRVNFDGFREIIDLIGGIDIVVASTIHDEEYPTADYGVETFHLNAGPQHLDGETALKYARTRHTDDDYNRARRQQEIIRAVADKVLSADMIPQLLPRVPQVLMTMQNSIETDIPIPVGLDLANLVSGSSLREVRQLVLDSQYGEETYSSEGTAALSSKGEAAVTFSLPEQTTHPGPRSVSVTASITDANQQTLSGSKRFTVHSWDFYLGLREPDGVFRAGDKATFAMAAVTTEGKAHTEAVETSVLVEKEEWTTVKVMGANGKMTHRNDLILRTISDERIALKTEIDAATGLTRAMPHSLTFAEAGDYQITLTAKDQAGRDILTKIKFSVIGAEEPSWSWHDVIRIDLTPDKESYRIGDTAKLLARTPVFGNALFTIERGGVRETRSLVIGQYETVLEVPVVEGAAPNLFASLLIIRGSGESPHVHKSADYRLGYCQLLVEDPSVKLTTKVTAGDAKFYQPGEQIEFTATVLDDGNRPVAGAEVTFYAVDEGILSLTGYETPDPGATFHAPFPLSVWTGQSLGDLLPENPLEQDFANKGYVIGGGGGGFGLDPDRIRKDFKALAFWEASLLTDANGIVRAKAVAPDNLTTFRVIAVVAEGNRFGSGETPVVINKPLMIEPALPGFTNVTDQIDIAAVLHNNSGAPQEVEVSVTLDEHAMFVGRIGETIHTNLAPAAGAGEKRVKVSLPNGATETVSFPVAMTATGEAKWTWKVRSLSDEKLRDAVESKFAVGYPLPLLRETHTFALRDGSDLGDALAKMDRRLLEGEGTVTVTLSNSRLIEAVDGLEYLLKYPYGCVEQTTSSTIPWLSTQQLRKVLPGLEKSEEEVAAIIAKGVNRIFSMQTSDGGLAYWPGGSESLLWGSAYAGVAVALAEKQGVPVPKEQAQALRDYLSLQLRGSAEVKDPYALSQRCLAAYALALAGVNETAYHEVLFEKQNDLTAEARSLLALAMVESGAAQMDRVQALLKPPGKVPVAEVSWYRQPYIVATQLLAQVRHNPANPANDKLVDDLMKLREVRNGWGSTYSNAWPLIALAAYGEVAAKQMGANEIELAFDGATKKVSLPAEPGTGEASFTFKGRSEARKLSLKTSGDGAVFANLSIATRPALVPIEPENRGFAIRRTYEKVEIDGSIKPAENLKVGDLILVTLDLNIPNERETYLAIDDALPAIFEAVHDALPISETQRVNAQRNTRRLYTTHSEIRKDRVLFFADSIYGAGDYSLQYLARVVAPGEVTAPPAKIEAMYEPQRFGLSGTGRITAAPRPLDKGEVAAK